MKKFVRRLVRSASRLPVIGRFLRIVVHLYRLPEFREQTIERQALVDAVPSLLQRSADVDHQLAEFGEYQLKLEKLYQRAAGVEESLGDVSHRLAEFDARHIKLEELFRRAADIEERFGRFQNEQIPSLLSSVSEIAARQQAADVDKDNIVRSVPVALRRMQRTIHKQTLDFDRMEAQALESEQSLRSELQEVAAAQSTMLAAVDTVRDDLVKATERINVVSENSATTEMLSALVDEAAAHKAKLLDAADGVEQTRADVENLTAQTGQLWRRLDFIRQEMMFEMRYGASRPADNVGLDKVETKIINREKYELAKSNGGLRFNVGCGHIPLPKYLNVDRRELPDVDIVADVFDLPAVEGEVSEIFSSHLLEHFPQEQLSRELLPYWISLLSPGGTFRAVVPDAQAMLTKYIEGDYPYEKLRQVTYGAQDYDGDFHFNMFTPESLKTLLRDFGLKDVDIVDSARINGDCYEFEIHATKPSKQIQKRRQGSVAKSKQ